MSLALKWLEGSEKEVELIPSLAVLLDQWKERLKRKHVHADRRERDGQNRRIHCPAKWCRALYGGVDFFSRLQIAVGAQHKLLKRSRDALQRRRDVSERGFSPR